MKRLLAFLITALFLFAFTNINKSEILNNSHISQLIVVSKEDKDLEKIKSGNQFYYKTNSNFVAFAQNFDNIDALILYFDDYSLKDIVSDYKIDYYRGGDVGEKQIFYGYTHLYNKSYFPNNKKANVQIAVQNNQIIVGFPSILIGF